MNAQDFDISSMLSWEEELPRPKWDLVETWVTSQGASETWRAAWTTAALQWIDRLADALGEPYVTAESANFLLVTPDEPKAASLLEFAANARDRILSVLGHAAGFHAAGKQVIVALKNDDDYYRYIAPHFPEGKWGPSGGVHIREGYAHVAINAKYAPEAETILAHELTHAALFHLSMPQWLEEGLAQTMEHDLTPRNPLMVDLELAARHKRYWSRKGLDAMWWGDGFARSGIVQGFCYQLAEILVRLIIQDSQPRWFGWVREPQRRFYAFLHEAGSADCGEQACREHLGYSLSNLATRFLGPGEWSPSSESPTKDSNNPQA
jgi:hypothetical protein